MAALHVERIGERLRARREELGLSRSQLARKMTGRTSEQQIYRWERGLHRPHDDTLESLAQALDVDVAYFIGEDIDPVVEMPAGGRSAASFTDRIDELLAGQARLESKLDALLARDELEATIVSRVERFVKAFEEDRGPGSKPRSSINERKRNSGA